MKASARREQAVIIYRRILDVVGFFELHLHQDGIGIAWPAHLQAERAQICADIKPWHFDRFRHELIDVDGVAGLLALTGSLGTLFRLVLGPNTFLRESWARNLSAMQADCVELIRLLKAPRTA